MEVFRFYDGAIPAVSLRSRPHLPGQSQQIFRLSGENTRTKLKHIYQHRF